MQKVAHYLDEIFEYVSVGPSDGLVSGGSDNFTDSFKDSLAQAYYTDQQLDDSLEAWGECAEVEEDDDLKAACQSLVDEFTPLKNIFFNNGFDRSSLDTSIALIFGINNYWASLLLCQGT